MLNNLYSINIFFQKAVVTYLKNIFFLAILYSMWDLSSLLLLLLSHFSHVWLCATPEMAAQSGFPIPGILQGRTLEWVAISFSNAWKWKVKVKSLSRVQLFATPWTTAYQAPPSMGFSRQEYWSGVPLPSLKYITVYLFLSWWTFIFVSNMCYHKNCFNWDFPGGSVIKNLPANRGDTSSILGQWRSHMLQGN